MNTINRRGLIGGALTSLMMQDANAIIFAGNGAKSRNWVAEGDSITAAGPTGYTDTTSLTTTLPINLYHNLAIGGSGIATLIARQNAVLSLKMPGTRVSNIFSVFIGTNDNPDNAWLTSLAGYLDTIRSAGWYVVLCTLMCNTSFLANAITSNVELRLWPTNGSTVPGKHCDAICDFGADSIMGTSGNKSDTTYFSDTVHPTYPALTGPSGHNRLYNLFLPAINAVP